MATGKTSVAKLVARKLGKRYVSTDNLIVRKSKKTIAQIFDENGEEAFRTFEVEVIEEVSKMENLVIDCGGGVIVNRINIERLKQNGIIFLLTASLNIILERNSREVGKRPLLRVGNQMDIVERLYNFRAPLYESSADYIINTTELSINQIAERVIEIMEGVRYKNASGSKKK